MQLFRNKLTKKKYLFSEEYFVNLSRSPLKPQRRPRIDLYLFFRIFIHFHGFYFYRINSLYSYSKLILKKKKNTERQNAPRQL